MSDVFRYGYFRVQHRLYPDKTTILKYALLILILSIYISFTEAKPNSFQLNLQRRLFDIEEHDRTWFTSFIGDQQSDMSFYDKYLDYTREYPFLHNSGLICSIVYNLPFELYEKYYRKEIPLFRAFDVLTISVHFRKEHYLRFKIPFYK